ncbi:Adenylyl-sulfate kinase [Nitrospira japonica]|uniref:Adenylyl-sulfate kinase n=1 Tax=Nitrospira japonica TaxID=1325564 RepID=A0A1W1I2L9_9BACT|nr:adenylyl-sulfate kinase [Nitrospira japonica]SLM47242.1 Adenylyl-sulfate kinase [Nitrospira japonica]
MSIADDGVRGYIDEKLTARRRLNPDPTSPTTHRVLPFAIWLTGLPASGKSTIVSLLRPELEALDLTVEVLESDEVRHILTPAPTYSETERDLFYRALAFLGARLVAHGITVVFDATATRRMYRNLARTLIPRLIEVSVECPLEVCMQRDYKGTYHRGQHGDTSTVPGLQVPYEPPTDPELRIDTTTVTPAEAARRIIALVRTRLFTQEEN